jgi:hypothetical protein
MDIIFVEPREIKLMFGANFSHSVIDWEDVV